MQLRAYLARSWKMRTFGNSVQVELEQSDRFNFRTTCPEVPDIQLPPNMGGSYCAFRKPGNLWPTWPQVQYLTSAQLGQKSPCKAGSRINLCSIWSQVGVYGVNFWSCWPEVLSENCVQVGHNFQLVTKLVTSWKGGLKKCRQVDDAFQCLPDSQNTANFSTSCREVKRRERFWKDHNHFTSSQLGTKRALRIIFNRNFVASYNKVPAIIIPNLGIIFRTQN